MGLLTSLAMLFVMTMFFFWVPCCTAQSPESSSGPARSLDALLQDYAYRAFFRPRTGIVYKGIVPSNITGIEVKAMRLRSGSLRTRGVPMYEEFQIPKGVVVSPYVERLVLVYQNLHNWSAVYYPLNEYTYLAPVVGLLAYDASNLKAINLPELDINASGDSLSINFSDVRSVPDGSVAKCVWFDLHGEVSFSNVVEGSVCSTIQQGHFSIVVESIAPSPAPTSPIPGGGGGGGTPNAGPGPSGKKNENNSKVWIIVGSVVGGLVLLVLLGLLALWVRKYKHRKNMQHMEKAAEGGEALRMTSVGNTKAPAAMVTRTQPTLENEYVP